MKNKLYLIIIIISSLISCGGESFDTEIEFRNYLRDKHPYSILTESNGTFFLHWTYQVTDTINNEICIYNAGKNNCDSYKIIINKIK